MTKCPNCDHTLHLWNIKAECPQCGVSIPNFNWEERLESDNLAAEKAFNGFNRTLNRFKYCFVGTKLRVVRLILSFIPIIGFILPWASISTQNGKTTWNLITVIKEMITLFSDGGLNSLITNLSFENYSGVVMLSVLSMLFFVLHVLFIVLAFFMILFTFKKPKSPATVVFDVLSIISSIVGIVLYSQFSSMLNSTQAFSFGSQPILNGDATLLWGAFVALLLLTVAMISNILVCRADAKSDDELEGERLAKIEAKNQQEMLKQKAKQEKKNNSKSTVEV